MPSLARRLTPAAVLAACAALPLAALADTSIRIEAAFALISPAGNSGAAFMRIDNAGAADDRLVAAESDIAMRTELHTHVEDADGVMRMIEVEEGFAIPAGGAHMLARGGDHVMFMGVTRVPDEGETIMLTLTFEQAGPVVLEVPVGGPMTGAETHDHSHGHSHGD